LSIILSSITFKLLHLSNLLQFHILQCRPYLELFQVQQPVSCSSADTHMSKIYSSSNFHAFWTTYAYMPVHYLQNTNCLSSPNRPALQSCNSTSIIIKPQWTKHFDSKLSTPLPLAINYGADNFILRSGRSLANSTKIIKHNASYTYFYYHSFKVNSVTY